MKVTEYTLVITKAESLAGIVSRNIRNGWNPLGAPTFILRGDPNYTQWTEGYQAMVRYDGESPTPRTEE